MILKEQVFVEAAFQFQGQEAVGLGVVFVNYMQDDVLIGLVGLVSVSVPVAAFHMDFHMAGPKFVADLDFGFLEVRPGIGIAEAGRTHCNLLAFCGLQVVVGQSVLPEVV